MAEVKLLDGAKWRIDVFGEDNPRPQPCATANIDIMRTSGILVDRQPIRWTYWIMVEVYKSKAGVTYNHDRACGQAMPAVISARKEEHREYPLVAIGDTLVTPWGNFIVDWASKTDHDNITLKEVK